MASTSLDTRKENDDEGTVEASENDASSVEVIQHGMNVQHQNVPEVAEFLRPKSVRNRTKVLVYGKEITMDFIGGEWRKAKGKEFEQGLLM